MKTVIVGPAWPLRGGIADFNEALAEAFQKENIEVVIFSFSYQYPSFLFPGTSQKKDSAPPKGLKINSTIHSLNPINWWNIALKIVQINPDFIIVRYWLPFMAPCLGSICRFIRWKKNIPIIAITDNVIPHEKRIGDETFTRYFLSSCDGFVAMSKSVLDELNQRVGSKLKSLLPHPVYTIFGEEVKRTEALIRLGLEEGCYLLFFGFIRKYKGLEILLTAMKDDRIKQLEIKLIVAGEFYEDPLEYKKMVTDFGLINQVIFHSKFIPQEEVKNYFSVADIVVQPYRSASQSGITQIATHFNRPSIVTNVGGLSDFILDHKTGYITPPDPFSVADAIVDFYSNNRSREFAPNFISEKERFSWKNMISGIIKLFREIENNRI